MKYFYEKRFYREDGEVYVKRFSRSFPLGEGVEQSDTPKQSNVSQASASRARSTVRLLAFSNPQLDGMLTLTFRDNLGVDQEDEAARRFKVFCKKVSRRYKGFQFLGVKELQKRGAIHYHLLVNFCPGIAPSPNNSRKRISTLWDYGFSDYSRIQGDDKWRTELYLLKYLGKEKTRLFTQHYVRSRNLQKVEPRHFDTREPLHPLAKNVWLTQISIEGIAGFDVLEYTYSIISKKRDEQYHGISEYNSK